MAPLLIFEVVPTQPVCRLKDIDTPKVAGAYNLAAAQLAVRLEIPLEEMLS
jgi:hypothetical protein